MMMTTNISNISATNMIADFTNFDISTAVTTYTGSKEFMKLMLPVTVINILHSRTDIARENFKKYVLKDMNYVSFKSKSTHKCIRNYHVWMKGAKDALDKTYLREMILIMKDQNDQVEHYKFRFKYLRNERSSSLPNSQNAKELMSAMRNMIQQIKDLQKYKKLTGDIEAKVEFIFYDDVTPSNYIPPHFYKISKSQMKKFYEGKSKDEIGSLDLGVISTGFHSLKCSAFGTLLLKYAETETQNTLCTVSEISSEGNASIAETPASKGNTERQSLSLTYIDDDVCNKMCICMKNISDPVLKVKTCTKCFCNYHIACHGYFTEDEVPSEFVCNICAKNENLVQDTIYFEKDEEDKSELCLLRLAIVYCYFKKNVPSYIFGHCKPAQQDKLKDRLIHLSVLTKKTLSYIPGMEENILVRKLFNKKTFEEDENHKETEISIISDAQLEDNSIELDKINTSSSIISLLSSEDEENFCICNVQVSLPSLPIHICSLCCKNYHIACVGYLYKEDVPDPFVCHFCLKPDELKKIDPKFFINKSVDHRKSLATMKLLIAYSILTKKYPQIILEQLTEERQQFFAQHLNSLEITNKNMSDSTLAKLMSLFKVNSSKLPDTGDFENMPKKRRLN